MQHDLIQGVGRAVLRDGRIVLDIDGAEFWISIEELSDLIFYSRQCGITVRRFGNSAESETGRAYISSREYGISFYLFLFRPRKFVCRRLDLAGVAQGKIRSAEIGEDPTYRQGVRKPAEVRA